MDGKGDTAVAVYYWLHTQDDVMDELFCKQQFSAIILQAQFLKKLWNWLPLSL